MNNFNFIFKKNCFYDAISLGEVLLRFDPVDVPFEKAKSIKIWHGGGETNVAEGLSYCFGLKTSVLTGLVDDCIGRSIENQIRESGVDTSNIKWFDNKNYNDSKNQQKPLVNGFCITYRGKGILPSKTDYFRTYSAAKEISFKDFNFEYLFNKLGVKSAHTGGIFALLSPKTSNLTLRFLKTAKNYGTFRSYDLNYRSKIEPNKKLAINTNKKIVKEIDFLVGNQDDFSDALGYPKIKEINLSFNEQIEYYIKTLEDVSIDYPNLKLIGTQFREPISADKISWAGILYNTKEKKIYKSIMRKNIEIIDRTGGGDSFASGVIASILKGNNLDEAVEWGTAHGILVQETPGDTTMVKQIDIENEVKRIRLGKGVLADR